MNTYARVAVFLTRVSMGWLFFYAGITKVLDQEWSAVGYLAGAKTLPGLFDWLASPGILPVVNFLNAWGLTLIGVSLILGFWIRIAAPLGAVLMLLYYIPILDFPYPNAHSYIVDEHIIYALVLLLLAGIRADKIWGIGK